MFSVSRLLYIFMNIVFAGLAVPIFVSAYFFLKMTSGVITLSDLNFLEMIACLFALVCMMLSALYIVFFVVPIPFCKNTFYIRWGVLANLNESRRHPQASKWFS